MATLQEQSDSAFSDSHDDLDLQGQRNAEDALLGEGGYLAPKYADEEGDDDYPPPTALESDGQGNSKPSGNVEFADDETNPGARMGDEDSSGEAGQEQRQTQDGDDIHSRQAAVEESQPKPEGISDSLIDRAQRYGMTPAQAKATYKTDSELESALLQYDQQLLGAVNQQQQAPPLQQQPQQQPMPTQQPQQQDQQAPQQQGQPADQQIAEFELKNAELYEEPLLEDMRGLSEYAKQQFVQQQQQLQMLRQTVEQQQQFLAHQAYVQQQEDQQRHINSFDGEIQSLGDDWSDVFGEGDHTGLDQNSAEIFNRGKVLNTVDQLMQLHQQQGRNVDMKSVLESSLQINFPGRQASKQAPSQQQPRDTGGRYSSFTNKPTGRSSRGKQVNPKENLYRKWDQATGYAAEEDYGEDVV